MEIVNELQLRNLLQENSSPADLRLKLLRLLNDPSMSWEELRPLWHYLYNIGEGSFITETLQLHLQSKRRIPFDILIELCARANVKPGNSVLESLFKGLKKQSAFDEILICKGWDKWDKRFIEVRAELLEKKTTEQRQAKDNMKEKFEFLKNQRMNDQAGRVLKRMIELYPEDRELTAIKHNFEEEWAREVLSNHMSTLQVSGLEHTRTEHSAKDQEMLKMFLVEGEEQVVDHRELALDLAVTFWFLEDFNRGLEILAWAEPSESADWLRAELLFASRRFVEALDHLNSLEVKYIEFPETTFSVSYLRARCLHALGQQTSALEIMQSIARVRPTYRSAHALLLEWSAGVTWE